MATISFPAQLARTRRFTLGVPEQFTVTPDGTAVLFLRSRAGDDPVACLWTLDLASGTERLLADPVRLASTPGSGIEAYAIDRAAGTLVAFSMAGGLWTVGAEDGRAARRIPVGGGPAADPRPDPTGRRIAYVCDGALRVIEADGSGDRAVLEPAGSAAAAGPTRAAGPTLAAGPTGAAGPPDVTYGVGEHTGATAADGRSRGYWWAPDGDRLLVARRDTTAVALWYVADPAEPAEAPRAVRHAAAGTANAEVTLWITGTEGAAQVVDGPRAHDERRVQNRHRPPVQVRWDRGAFEYVVGAGWDAQGPYAVVQSRDQRTVRFLGIDPVNGRTRVLSEQRDKRWVQLVPGLPARTASGALVTHADLRGTRYLTVGGTTVTPPGLQLRAVLGVDGDDVLFTASEDPAETHLWTHPAVGGLRRLSVEPGVHSGVRRGGTLVRIARCADRPGGRTAVLREGQPSVAVDSLAERPVLDVPATRLVLGPRELRAVLHLPSWHRPGSGRLPVLLDPYGGASLQRVTSELEWRTLVSQWFAEQGFAVLVTDGRGTPGRGPDWERAVHGDLFGPALDDQVTALREAARLHPELDLERVGIRGWSFGGTLAALAVLRRPDVFHAAVAGAGVTDQRLYHAHWRERFLGHPDEFPERYEASSLLRAAPRLTRPLLLIHGLTDGNVHPAHTLRLSGALLAAGRPHEVLLLPGVGHRPMGAPITEELLWHQVRFLQRHLDAPPTRDGHAGHGTRTVRGPGVGGARRGGGYGSAGPRAR